MRIAQRQLYFLSLIAFVIGVFVSLALLDSPTALVVVAFLLVIGIVISCRSLVLILIMYLIAMPLVEQTISTTTYSLVNPSVIVKAVVLIIFMIILLRNRINLLENQLVLPLIILIGFFTLTLIMVPNITIAVTSLIKLIHFVVIIEIVRFVVSRDPESLGRLWFAHIVSTWLIVISIVVASAAFGVSRAAQLYGAGALTGYFGTGIALVLAGSFALVVFYPQFFRQLRIIALVLALCLPVFVIASFQRTSIMMIIAQMIIYGIIGFIGFRRWFLPKVLAYLLIIVSLAGLYVSNYPGTVEYRLHDLDVSGDYVQNPKFASGRYYLWRTTLRQFQQRNVLLKLVGTGLGTAQYFTGLGHGAAAHNLFTRLLLEGGIVGCTIDLLFLWFFLKIIVRARKRSPVVFALGLCAFVSIMISTLGGESYFFSTQMHMNTALVLAIIGSGVRPRFAFSKK